jgi:hypothetical protein
MSLSTQRHFTSEYEALKWLQDKRLQKQKNYKMVN